MFIYVGTGVEKACLVTLLSKGTQNYPENAKTGNVIKTGSPRIFWPKL